MSESKDPAIKLFGKTIHFGSNSDGEAIIASRIQASASATADDLVCELTSSDDNLLCSKQGINRGNESQRCSTGESMLKNGGEESSSSSGLEESKTSTTSSTFAENPKTLSNDKYSSSEDLVQEEDQSDQTSITQSQAQNTPKKPDEIIPCPRCNSMETKFCYFNNYNVNQPRHFCKSCQRYWTAGGTMRKVRVGSGRRKNKNSSSLASQPLHLVTPEAPILLTHLAMRPSCRVLGSESAASTLKHRGSSPSGSLNGFMRPEMEIPGGGGGSRNQGKGTSQGLIPPQVACLPGFPWPYAWNPIPWQSGCPLPFYSASPQWVCNPPGSWNLHFLPNLSIYPDPYSPFLGKHSRDGTMLVSSNSNHEEPTKENRSENPQVAMPKKLRIVDDPIVVARSSVWGSLGGKKDKTRSSNFRGGLFGGFHQYKGVDAHERNITSVEGSHLAHQANPAAFSRCLSFHEMGQRLRVLARENDK